MSRSAYIRGRLTPLDMRNSWHYVTPRPADVVTRELAEAHARDTARRGGDAQAALARILPLIGKPIEELFR